MDGPRIVDRSPPGRTLPTVAVCVGRGGFVPVEQWAGNGATGFLGGGGGGGGED